MPERPPRASPSRGERVRARPGPARGAEGLPATRGERVLRGGSPARRPEMEGALYGAGTFLFDRDT